MTFYDAIKRVSRERAFLSCDRGETLSYGELCTVAAHFEATFSAAGLAAGDAVVVIVPEGPTAVATIVATLMAVVAAPLNPSLAVPELLALMQRMRPKGVVVSADVDRVLLQAINALGLPVWSVSQFKHIALTRIDDTSTKIVPSVPAVSGNGAAGLLLPTSGTSGEPKLVQLSHARLMHAATAMATVLELSSADRNLCVLPCFHIHGLSTVLATLLTGGCVIAVGPFSTQWFLPVVVARQVSWLSATPTHFQALVNLLKDKAVAVESTALRFLRSASAPLSDALLAATEAAFSVPVIQAYGMTEAGPLIASNGVASEHRRSGSVGRPVGTEVSIRSVDGQAVGTGVVGEIVIRGAGVIEQYYADEPGEPQHLKSCASGWFHTGDLGCLDADGFLYVTGRSDDIINCGGEKIAPQDLEAVLQQHPAVQNVVAFPAPHAVLGEVVHAAVVLHEGFLFADDHHDSTAAIELILRRYCLSHLAGFKVPHKFHFLQAIPLKDNSKLQRRKLHAMLESQPRPDVPCVAQNLSSEPLLQAVGAAWADVLGPGQYHGEDNFFQCGGDSLSATMAINRLAHAFAVELPVDAFFRYPTLAQQAALLSRVLSARSPGAAPLADALRADCIEQILPLSRGQRRLWFLDQAGAGSEYNMSAPVWLRGALDCDALAGAMNALRQRHSVLRTTINRLDGNPVQRICTYSPAALTVVDLSELSPEVARERALELAGDYRNEPFDLFAGPLFRYRLVRLDTECHLLLIAIHHIVCDGWSMEILRRDLRKFYHMLATGVGNDTAAGVTQYADYVSRTVLNDDHSKARKAVLQQWWRQELESVDPVLKLPYAAGSVDRGAKSGARLHFELSSLLLGQLGSVAQRVGTTLYAVFVGSLGILLHRYCGQQRFCLGTVDANRGAADMEQVVGFFARTMPLPVSVLEADTIGSVLDRAAQTVRDVLAHADLEFDEIVQASGVARSGDSTPLFQVMLAFQNIPHVVSSAGLHEHAVAPGGLEMEDIVVDGNTAKYDLSLYLRPSATGMKGIWQYRSDKMDASVIKTMAEDFSTILHAVVDSSHKAVAEIPLRGAAPVSYPVQDRSPPASRDPLLLPVAFARQVAADPHRIAISSASGQSTYGDLSARINRLANFIQAEMAGRTPVVAVFLPRDECMVVAAMAVMSAGAAFLPLEPRYPPQRLREMLVNVDVSLLIVNHETQGLLSDLAGEQLALPRAVCLDDSAPAILQSSSAIPARPLAPDDAAYIVFTSGSTGRPKGVVLSHGNLAHYIEAMSGELEIVETDSYLYAASCAFSASVRQFALPLANGAKVVVATRSQTENMAALIDLVTGQGVTILDLVPTAWQACYRWLSLSGQHGSDDTCAQLRLLLSASEPLPAHLARTLSAYWPHATLINMYGQTETTGIVAMNKRCSQGIRSNVVPLGQAIKSATLVLLDAEGRPVPAGSVGEICVGGACVGQGYITRHELAPLALAPLALPGQDAMAVYRTGDLGRYCEHGGIEFCGRVDTQIKYRGFRIEPGDIEAIALSHPAVTEAAVFQAQHVSRADTHELHLVYSAVRDSTQQIDETQLRHHLRDQLPDYMVPARLLELQALPRTPAGKVDRTALAAVVMTEGAGTPASLPATPAQDSEAEAARQTLMSIWKDVLGCEVVGAHDNFFDLGGNSILSIEVVADAMDAGLNLELDQLFRYQTIAELAPIVVAGRSVARAHDNAGSDPPGVPTAITPAELPRYSIESLRAFSLEALEQVGLSTEGARVLTEVQLESSLRGQVTHNIGDVPRYAKRLASGVLNASPTMTVTDTSAISATVDGDNAPGQWVATVAIDKAIALAVGSGAGFVSVKRSNHFGAAGHYAWRASQAGMIGLCFTNGPVVLAPTGGVTPLFGNNPIAIGLPCGDSDPVVLDIAMSVATRGKIGLTVAEGEPLQPGWILDKLGIPSTALEDLAAGLAAPIGGHKGYGLAFAIEALAGALSGAGYCRDHDREASARHGGSDIGHLFIAFSPDLFMARDQYEARLADIVQQTKSSELASGSLEIFVPGEIELRARRDNLRRGIPLPESTVRRLTDYGKRHNLRANIERVGND